MSEATANLCTTDAAEAMRVTIAEQAREIERLTAAMQRVDDHYQAQKAQPSGVVDSQRLLDWNRSQPEPRPIVVGREYQVAEACARLNSSTVSAGEPAKCSYQDEPRSPSELSLAGCNCVRFGECNPHWPCKIHPAVSAGGVDERAAFEAWCQKTYETRLGKDWRCVMFEVNHGDKAFAAFKGGAEWQARAALPVRDHSEQVRHMVPSVKQIAEALNDVRCFHELSAELIAPMLRENLVAAIFETSNHAGDV